MALRIEFHLHIGRDRPAPDEQPEPPAVYDTAPAHIERDPSLETEVDPEVRRIGFHAKETQ